MKRTFFTFGFLVALLSWSSLYSQDTLATANKVKINRYFVGVGVFTDFNSLGGNVNGTLLLTNNIGLGLNFKTIGYKSKNKPADYYPGSNVLGGDPKNPFDHADFYSLTFIKEINTNKKKVRIGFEAGPSYNQFHFHSFKSIVPFQGIFGYTGNYSVKSETKNTIGLSAKGKIYYLFTNHFALEFVAFTNISSHDSFLGIEINTLFGILKKKKN